MFCLTLRFIHQYMVSHILNIRLILCLNISIYIHQLIIFLCIIIKMLHGKQGTIYHTFVKAEQAYSYLQQTDSFIRVRISDKKHNWKIYTVLHYFECSTCYLLSPLLPLVAARVGVDNAFSIVRSSSSKSCAGRRQKETPPWRPRNKTPVMSFNSNRKV